MAAGRCKSAATSIGRTLLFKQQACQLAAGGRLARALQAAQHQDVDVFAQANRRIDRPQQVDQLVADDAHDFLAGIERQQTRRAHRPLGDRLHESCDDVVADVGFEQRLLDQPRPSRMLASVSLPLPRKVLRAERIPSCSDSNMRTPKPGSNDTPSHRHPQAGGTKRKTHILRKLLAACKWPVWASQRTLRGEKSGKS